MSEKKTKKRKHIVGAVSDDELEYLEKIVLGDGTEIYDEKEDEKEQEEITERETKLPAWIDESELSEDPNDNTKASRAYRLKQFYRVSKKPKWAESTENQTEINVLQKSGKLIVKTKDLKNEVLNIKKLKDLNTQAYADGPVNVIKFHPKSTVGMVGSMRGVLSFFQVDGKENTKLMSVQMYKTYIDSASFVKDGEEVIVGSRYLPHFHTYNLMTGQTFKVSNAKMDGIKDMKKFVVSPDDKVIAVCGQFGKIHLLSGRSKECIDNFQMNCSVNALSFSENGSKLYSIGDDGDVYIWDMRSRRCMKKFTDHGSINGLSIDVSQNEAFLACGSNTGVVNVYDMKDVMSDNFKPLKTIFNLVTPVTNIKFNPSSEILCISSFHKQDAIKLIHLNSMTVYKNFPLSVNKLGNVKCVDFSPNGGYFAAGVTVKKAHLFRITHFGNY